MAPAPELAGSFTLTLSDSAGPNGEAGDDLVATDVVFGDVYLCTGQVGALPVMPPVAWICNM